MFNSWYWNRLWWQHYGDLGELCTLVVRIDNVVEGIAPLYRCKTRALKLHTVETLRFIGSGGDTSPDDLGVLVNREFEELVISTICQTLFNQNDCERLQLYDMVENGMLATKLKDAAVENGWRLPLQRDQKRLVDALPGSIEAYEKTLSRNARKQRKRRRQQLHNAGKVQYTLCKSREDIDDAFAHLQRLHKIRQHSKGVSGSFQSVQYCGFHLSLMLHALENNELRLLKLNLDDKTIGIEYAFLSKGVLYFFQTGFDPEYEHLSPGHILMMQTIDQAINDGAHQLDLLKGEYPYKNTYAKKIRTTVTLDVWKNPVMHRLSKLARTLMKLTTGKMGA